ncbi:glycosyl hydrolase family 18 protein [Deinococcus sp.]|uniref:glycosyl hydrolase family 18 protein n=1 Tax=Deinococcus sp. TaxID=47478 RepID=UPI003B5CFDA3
MLKPRTLALSLLTLTLAACSNQAVTPAAQQGTLSTQAVSCVPWDASSVYLAGDTVTAGGVTYKAGWWTQGNNPATNSGPAGSGQVWTVVSGGCGTTNPPPVNPPPVNPPTGSAPFKLNQRYSLQVTTNGLTNRYLRHYRSEGFTEIVDASSNSTLKADATFQVVAGLSDPNCFSFQSVNIAGNYLRHALGRLRIDPDNGGTFKADATFCAKAALSGAAGAVSLEAKNFPGRYIRHRNAEVWVEASTGGTFNADASWTPREGWSLLGDPPAPPPVNPPPVTPPNTSGYKRVGYFVQWGTYSRNFQVADLVKNGAGATLTHLNYSFGGISADGQCTVTAPAPISDAYADYQKSFTGDISVDGVADVYSQTLKGNFNQLKKLKAKYPSLKVLISLGGWTLSKNFSDVALTDAARKKFVSSCLDLYIKGNLPVADGAGGPAAAAGIFDGIDIDWEFPGSEGNTGNIVRAEDTRNFTLLLEEFRRQLGTGRLLTAALPASPEKIGKIEVANVSKILDYLTFFGYDFRGGFSPQGPTGFQSNLYKDPNDKSPGEAKDYAIETAVDTLLRAGAPANKIIPGMPYYGRGWTGVANVNNGLHQTAGNPAQGKYEAGVDDYKEIIAKPGTVYRDDVTKAPWKFDGSNFWTYDDPQSIGIKMNYIKQRGLGGSMAWAMDGEGSDAPLSKAIFNGLK